MGCIYQAKNRIDGKSYVGKTKSSIEARKNSHELVAKRGSKLYFHSALRKYGFGAFEWTVLFEEDKERLLDRWEKFYIKRLNTLVPNGYNLSVGGGGGVGPSFTPEMRRLIAARTSKQFKGKKQTPETIAKRKAAMMGHIVSEETRRKIALANTGKKHTPEIIAQISAANIGRIPWNKGKTLSKEHRFNLSASHQGKPIPLEQRIKISQALKGKVKSSETRMKMSEAQRENKKRLGQHNSEEHKANQRMGWAKRKLALMMLGA